MKTPLLAVTLLSLALASGCGDKSSSTSGSSGAGSSETKKKEAGPEKDAFMMGRKLGYASAYELLKENDQLDKVMGEASAFAKTLGVAAPAKGDAMKARDASAAEIQKKHGDKASAAFLLGFYVTDAWFGAELGAKIDVPLGEVEKNAKASGAPESVWRTKFDGQKAAATGKGMEDLAKAFEEHFSKS